MCVWVGKLGLKAHAQYIFRSVKSAARAKDSLRLEEDVDQNDETDTDTSVLLYNLVRDPLSYSVGVWGACQRFAIHSL